MIELEGGRNKGQRGFGSVVILVSFFVVELDDTGAVLWPQTLCWLCEVEVLVLRARRAGVIDCMYERICFVLFYCFSSFVSKSLD